MTITPKAAKVKPRRNELSDRITDYLSNGGLFNPEMMEHDKVGQLLIDCRAFIDALPASPEPASGVLEAKPGQDGQEQGKWLVWHLEHQCWMTIDEFGWVSLRRKAGAFSFARAKQLVLEANAGGDQLAMVPH